MLPVAALTGPLPRLGAVAVAALAAAAVLTPEPRRRAGAMLGALVLAPLLLLADIWHSPQLHLVHRHPLVALIAAALGLGLIVAVALALGRRPSLLALLAVLALPFRIPIQAGVSTANLLVPLYLVVAAGTLSAIIAAFRSDASARRVEGDAVAGSGARVWLERLLAGYILLYGVQSVYSSDFEKGLQQLVFFYVPFSLLFCLLRDLPWSARLLRRCLVLVIGLALVFAVVGFAEYETKTLLLNPKLIAANDFHTYFTVNSVFFDPDIFGRFLALVMICAAAVLLYGERPRAQLACTVALAVLWAGLLLTLSRSSLGALLVGLATLAGLRWRAAPVLGAAAAIIVAGAIALALSPKTFGLNQGLNGASSGRAGLVSGGISLIGDRPIWGYGSGSFVHEYRAHHPGTAQTLSASHTIPITIGAEQGLIGELVYVALVVAACALLLRGARAHPARAALAAAFLALMFHTMLYADFLEDPVTWTLLGLGTALAARAPAMAPGRSIAAGRAAPAPAPA